MSLDHHHHKKIAFLLGRGNERQTVQKLLAVVSIYSDMYACKKEEIGAPVAYGVLAQNVSWCVSSFSLLNKVARWKDARQIVII